MRAVFSDRLSLAAVLFITCFFIYAICSPGNLPGDTETRWSVARQFVRTTEVSIEDSVKTQNYAIGIDGKRHSVWNPGQAALFVPFTALGSAIETLAGAAPGFVDLLMQFLVSVGVFPFIGAACVYLAYRILTELGYGTRPSCFTALSIGFLSPLFHYSVCTQEESQVAFLLLLAAGLLQRYRGKHSLATASSICTLFGLAIFIRSSALPIVFPLFLVAVIDELFKNEHTPKFQSFSRWFLAGCIGTAPFVVLVCLHNYVRFGDIFEHGYQEAVFRRYGLTELFAAKPLPTILSVLASPGKGLLWYCPILLVAVFGFRDFYKKFPFLLTLCLVAALGSLVFNSFFTIWAGDLAWGPRFQTSIIPLLLLPIVEIYSRKQSSFRKILFGVFLSTSLLVQSASVLYNFNLEFWQNPRHGPVPNDYTWKLEESHLLLRFRNIALHLQGEPDLEVEQFLSEDHHVDKVTRSTKQLRIAHSLNFFPFKARALMGESGNIITALFTLWFLLVLAALVSSRALVKRLSNESSA